MMIPDESDAGTLIDGAFVPDFVSDNLAFCVCTASTV